MQGYVIKFDVAVLSLFGSTANHHMGIITTDSVYIECMLQQNLLVADGKHIQLIIQLVNKTILYNEY